MKSVNITELKNRLSVYLNDVKAGEEILVRERNQPIARIVPLASSRDEEEELLALASQGKLRLGKGILEESFWEMPAPRVSTAALRRAVNQEREGTGRTLPESPKSFLDRVSTGSGSDLVKRWNSDH